MVVVDVYVWQSRIQIASVGHVMVTAHCSKIVFLSQYPHPPGGSHASKGQNYHFTFEQTIAAQARPANAIFSVTLPNELEFRKMVENHQRRQNWNAWPGNTNSTHCARSAADALLARGLKTLHALDNGGQILPDELFSYLSRVAFLERGAPPKQAWQVRLRSGNACIR
jgi:hypothetical protein